MKSLHDIPQLSIQQTTLAFLRDGDRVMLAMKKRGFGTGKWNGVGGKQDKDETIEQSMARETFEEIGVKPEKYQRAAILNFNYLARPEWNQQVHVFLITSWEGEPIETEEMDPDWYDAEKLPFDHMWPDDPFWLPKVLSGRILFGEFSFNDQSQVVSHHVIELQ